MGRLLVKTKNNISTITTLGLVAVTSFIGFNLAAPQSSATSASAAAAVIVPEACTLVSTLNTPHTATLSPGTSTGYGNAGGTGGIGQTTLKVSCNDPSGFAIYAIGYTEETYGNNTLVSNTKNNGVSAYTISTGTATSGANSNWAMQINAVSGTFAPTIQNSFDSSSYHNVPAEYTMVAKRTSSTMDPADSSTMNVGSSITTTYAAYISTSQAADTYTGKVKYTMVHPNTSDPGQQEVACEAGKICYNANTLYIEGQMGKQTVADNDSVVLYASNFKRDGYGFAGWNDAYDYSGTFYGPNQTITVPTGTTANGLSLYAVWIPSAGTIQNWGGCGSLVKDPADGTATLTSVTALTDQRDGNTYAVAKLADGKCWTIENLRLADKDSNNNYINLSSSNTHNPSLPLTNDYTNSTTSDHLSPSTDPPQAAWCARGAHDPICFRQSMLNTNNTTLFTNNTTSAQDSNIYSYGNYYNWYSATAGHGKIGDGTMNVYVAPGDICPAGWHLPTADSSNDTSEFNLLYAALGGLKAYDNIMSAKFRSYPNNFVFSGIVTNLSIANRNVYGANWSSSELWYYQASSMLVSDVLTRAGGDFQKSSGMTVRCMAGV